MIVGHFLGTGDFNLMTGTILWSIAVGLFLTGHKIEKNLRAMTLIILFRYFSSIIQTHGVLLQGLEVFLNYLTCKAEEI
jgi:hypothetical protein